MNIVIRTDASIHIGSGHVMRCLVLADKLKGLGHQVVFACRPQPGDLIQFIQDKDFPVYGLSRPTSWKEPSHSADYESWLQVPSEDDVSSLLMLTDEVDLVIVDHYGINSSWEKRVKENLNCKVVVIDDLDRNHDCDLILDQNLWPNSSTRYKGSLKQKLLIGPRFALLRPLFNKIRSSEIKKENKVIVFFGGSDPTSECLKLMKGLQNITQMPFFIHLITGKSNSDYEELVSMPTIISLKIEKFTSNFEEALACSKYAIGASGVSNWERFCLNIPTSVVSVAENQRLLSEYLSELKLINYLGEGGETTPETYEKEFIRLKENWDTLAEDNILNIDGLGAIRVANEINQLINL